LLALLGKGFFGKVTLSIEDGKIITLKKEETLKEI
jgi:hypothetical protein